MKLPRQNLVAWMIATWFGCGLSPIAPGTMGTLAALPLYFAVRGGGAAAVFAVALVTAGLGIWASNIVVKVSGEKDPQRIVIDEVAGVLLTLSAVPATSRGVTLGVIFFRLFDIFKPFPIRHAERLPGGWGVVVDDLAAGIGAAIAVAVIEHNL